MPASKQLPASIRHLKARLQVLKRPTVLASASVLALAMFFLSQYWDHPEGFMGLGGDRSSSDTARSNASPNRAASDPSNDIRSLDGLLGADSTPSLQGAGSSRSANSLYPDLSSPSGISSTGQQQDSQSLSSAARQSTVNPNSSSFDLDFSGPSMSGSTGSAAASSTTGSAAAASGLGGLSNSFSNASSTGSAAASNRAGSTAASSPIQSALDRAANRTSSASDANSSLSTQTSSGYGQPSTLSPSGQSSTQSTGMGFGQGYAGQGFSGSATRQPQYLPQTSPPSGTTGYTLPPGFRAPTNSSMPSSTSYGSSGYGNSTTPQMSGVQAAPSQFSGFGQSSSSGSRQVNSSPAYPNGLNSSSNSQSQINQASPFSVPRTPPGRFIGGGQINTFSNP